MGALTDTQVIIRDMLIFTARRRRTVDYRELGMEVGWSARGPWRTDLDAIAQRETESGRPDLTLIVVSHYTGLPGIYRGKILKKDDRDSVEQYEKDRDSVYDYWGETGCCASGLPKPYTKREMAEFARGIHGRLPGISSAQDEEDQAFIDAIAYRDWGEG